MSAGGELKACPQCGECLAVSPCAEHSGPGHRHAVLCGRCRALLVLDGTTLRNPTDAEFTAAMGSPVIQYTIAQLAEAHRQGMFR